MQIDHITLMAGVLVFSATLLSLRLGISVAIIEVILGMSAASFGFQPSDWMLQLANFGGILLTFLAGAEVDPHLSQKKLKETILLGSFSFGVPFLIVFLYAFFLSLWSLSAALIAATALSSTSLAVVYSVVVETGIAHTPTGKLLMAATFVTNLGSALTLTILFITPDIYTVVFLLVSLLVLILAPKFTSLIFNHPRLKKSIIEPEIKYIFLLLLVLVFFANLGKGPAILPAFLLGVLLAKYFTASAEAAAVKNRLRAVAYTVITPIFFLVCGLKISLPIIASSFSLFAIFFLLKIVAKFFGVYFLAKKYLPQDSIYISLLLSTGLTFGTIASVLGLTNGIIGQGQYSVLVGAILASAIIPTCIAQKWFMPAPLQSNPQASAPPQK